MKLPGHMQAPTHFSPADTCPQPRQDRPCHSCVPRLGRPLQTKLAPPAEVKSNRLHCQSASSPFCIDCLIFCKLEQYVPRCVGRRQDAVVHTSSSRSRYMNGNRRDFTGIALHGGTHRENQGVPVYGNIKRNGGCNPRFPVEQDDASSNMVQLRSPCRHTKFFSCLSVFPFTTRLGLSLQVLLLLLFKPLSFFFLLVPLKSPLSLLFYIKLKLVKIPGLRKLLVRMHLSLHRVHKRILNDLLI
ncbi:unnamed protein product [Symbiodinium sp. CCMP2456]|nr:unnamed protein product [Symbiodinium sp. CCMP2456]